MNEKSLDSLERKCGILEEELRFSRKREMVLADRVSRLKSILGTDKSIIAILDKKGLVIEWSFAAEQMYHISREEILGKDFLQQIFNDTERLKVREEITNVLEGNPTKSVGSKAVKQSGELRRILWDISPMLTDEGSPYGVVVIGQDITDQKKYEHRLEKSEASLNEAQRIAHIGNWDWDIVNDELYWTDEIYRIFGFDMNQFGATYEAFLNGVHPEDRTYVTQSVEAALTGKKEYNIDHRVVLKDGTLRWVHEQGKVFFDEHKKPVRMLGTVQDITEQKFSEDALRESERKYRTLLEHIPQKIFYKDSDSCYVACNERYARDLKIDPEDIVGKSDFDFHPGELAEKYQADDKKVMAGGKVVTFEEAYVLDGKEYYVHTMKAPVRDGSGSVVGLLGIFHDISDRKRMEMDLIDQKEHLRNIMQTASDAIITTDHRLSVILWNRSAEIMFGYSAEEAIGHPLPFIMANEVKDAHMKGVKRALETGNSEIIGNTYESLAQDREGNIFPVEISLAKWLRGENIFFTGIVRDITERKKVEKELKRFANTQVELLREVNHRVKNNLTAMISLLHRNKERAIEKGLHECDELFTDFEGRIESLLTVHSMLSETSFRPLPLTELFEKIIKGVLNSTSIGTRINYSMKTSPLLVSSNEAHQLAMVFNELAINSLKHGAGARDTLAVSLNIEHSNATIRLTYKDDGPGFSQEVISDGYKGKGIGFELIRGIITRNLKGEVRYSNDKGAVVTITIDKDIFTEDVEDEGSK